MKVSLIDSMTYRSGLNRAAPGRSRSPLRAGRSKDADQVQAQAPEEAAVAGAVAADRRPCAAACRSRAAGAVKGRGGAGGHGHGGAIWPRRCSRVWPASWPG